MRYAHGFMALVFLGFAALQLNDPDPFLWTGIYTLAAAICVGVVIERVVPPVAAMLAAACLSGVVVLSKRVIGLQPIFTSEEGKEMMGLAIVAVWTGGIALREALRRPRAEGSA